MTQSFTVKKNYVLSEWNGVLFEDNILDDINNNKKRYIDSLNLFYLNPENSAKRRKNFKEQLRLSHISDEKIHRIEPTKYPNIDNIKLKNNIISWDHINMWQKAFDLNCDGALFFEDDVYFLKNWTQIIENIFNKIGKNNIDILRLDPAPLISTIDLSEKQIIAYNSQALACLGGYYMSRDALTVALNIVKTQNWKWDTIENLMVDIMSYFNNKCYETSPRICIQNWFLNDGSALQNDEHMKKIKDTMLNGYLQRYYKRYMFNNDIHNLLFKLFEEYSLCEYREISVNNK